MHTTYSYIHLFELNIYTRLEITIKLGFSCISSRMGAESSIYFFLTNMHNYGIYMHILTQTSRRFHAKG